MMSPPFMLALLVGAAFFFFARSSSSSARALPAPPALPPDLELPAAWNATATPTRARVADAAAAVAAAVALLAELRRRSSPEGIAAERAATLAFQRAAGLAADGVYGPRTGGALYYWLREAGAAGALPEGSVTFPAPYTRNQELVRYELVP
jgi:hypothetical protein